MKYPLNSTETTMINNVTQCKPCFHIMFVLCNRILKLAYWEDAVKW